MIDLDALQRKLDTNQSLDDGPEYQDVGALVAELRVAREVVEAARQVADADLHDEDWPALLAALKAYDQAVTRV